jgi:uncharacterized membrane protein YraQ (UPF0718 family)
LIYDVFHREFIYLWYYFNILFNQIFPFWAIGIVIGSVVSVFAKEKINNLFVSAKDTRMGLLGVIPASMLGIVSPLCMYGTIPIVASFYKKRLREDWLAAFMMSSVLLNPQLIIYSAVLGIEAFIIRITLSILAGITAGVLIYLFYRKRSFFNLSDFGERVNRDTHPNLFIRLLKNIWRNVKVTWLYFFIGIILTVLFQRYVPNESFVNLFGEHHGFGVLMAATLGIPVYVCGGGTIPLLMEWLHRGMSLGAAGAFMVSGPATKITNLGAMKIALGFKNFAIYIAYVMLFSLVMGLLIDLIL